MKIDSWIVVVGSPIYTCKTRKQARAFAKKFKPPYKNYKYIGKCVKNYRQIILDC